MSVTMSWLCFLAVNHDWCIKAQSEQRDIHIFSHVQLGPLGPRKDQSHLRRFFQKCVGNFEASGFSEASLLMLPSTQITQTSTVWFWPFFAESC